MKRIVDVLTKIASMLFQGGLFGGKVTPQGSFVQFIFMMILALFVLSRFQAQVFNCSQLPTDIVSTSNWEVANSTLPAGVVWERTLTQRDSLLAVSNDEVVFNRGSDSSGCSGGRVIALDASSGGVKWVFPADLIRNVTSIPGGYLLAKCCTLVILLNANGSKIWESDTISSKTFEPKFVLVDDNAYFIEDSDTYELSLDDGSLERISQGSQTQEAFWLRQLIFPVGTSNYRVYRADDAVITVRLPDHLFAYQIPTGEMLWEANIDFQGEPVFIGDNLITVNSQHVIQVHDVHSGHEIGQITLHSNSQANSNGARVGMLLAASRGKIFIRDFETSELFALNVELPE